MFTVKDAENSPERQCYIYQDFNNYSDDSVTDSDCSTEWSSEEELEEGIIARVLFDFCDPNTQLSLSIKEGDFISVAIESTYESNKDSWIWVAKRTIPYDEGFVPFSYLDLLLPLHKQQWYVGDMWREQAEQILMKSEVADNTFCVRDAESGPHKYVICIRFHNKIKSKKIFCNDDGYSIVDGLRFPTLVELIEYHRNCDDPWQQLGTPLNKILLLKCRNSSIMTNATSSSFSINSSDLEQTDNSDVEEYDQNDIYFPTITDNSNIDQLINSQIKQFSGTTVRKRAGENDKGEISVKQTIASKCLSSSQSDYNAAAIQQDTSNLIKQFQNKIRINKELDQNNIFNQNKSSMSRHSSNPHDFLSKKLYQSSNISYSSPPYQSMNKMTPFNYSGFYNNSSNQSSTAAFYSNPSSESDKIIPKIQSGNSMEFSGDVSKCSVNDPDSNIFRLHSYCEKISTERSCVREQSNYRNESVTKPHFPSKKYSDAYISRSLSQTIENSYGESSLKVNVGNARYSVHDSTSVSNSLRRQYLAKSWNGTQIQATSNANYSTYGVSSYAKSRQPKESNYSFDYNRSMNIYQEKSQASELTKISGIDSRSKIKYSIRRKGQEKVAKISKLYEDQVSQQHKRISNSKAKSFLAMHPASLMPIISRNNTNDNSMKRSHDKKWFISFEDLDIIERIGCGNYGKVYQAKWEGCLVAVKKFDSAKMSKRDFKNEARIMKSLVHPCLVKLLGVCTEKNNMFLIMEFYHNGSVIDYFKRGLGRKLLEKDLLEIAHQVSSGMTYLEEKDFIHRDLAARNILLNEHLEAKIADFGLARRIKHDVHDFDRDLRGAYKWTAPEALKSPPKWSSSCDIWSYGIFLWELFTRGGYPYPDIKSENDLLTILYGQYRLPKPYECTDWLYHGIMKRCWLENPKERITFQDVKAILKAAIH